MVTRAVPAPAPSTSSSTSTPAPIDLLILGAGWTSTFLLPLLSSQNISHAATSTTGRDKTIKYVFDPSSDSLDPYKALPDAKTVLITFPLTGKGQGKHLVKLYEESRSAGSSSSKASRLYIQLGSTGIFTAPHWNTSTSSYDTTNARAIAEDELLSLSSDHHNQNTSSANTSTHLHIKSTVLNLSGLWGAQRQPRNWLHRVIKKRSDLVHKKALHLVHGADVAQAILGAHLNHDAVNGQRWIVTDLHVYDWWDLVVQWATEDEKLDVNDEKRMGLREFVVKVESEGEDGKERTETLDLQREVFKLLVESGIRALPRDPDSLGRVLDGREFWRVVGRHPTVGRVT